VEVKRKASLAGKNLKTSRLAKTGELFDLSFFRLVNRVGITVTRKIFKSAGMCYQLIENVHHLSRDVFHSFLYNYEGQNNGAPFAARGLGLDSLVVGENEILGQLKDASEKPMKWERRIHFSTV